jgi:glycerophosphoryl diester phosphodiesterase
MNKTQVKKIVQKKFFETPTKLLAHRGIPLEYPENTLISFKKAVEFGVDVLETDTHLSKDKRFVILHDDDISRVSDGTGKPSDYSLEELKKFDAGYNFTNDNGETFPFRGKGITFTSVDEILSEFPHQKFNIDLKDNNPNQVQYWVELIKEYDAEHRVLTASQYTSNLKVVRKHFPNMATCFSAKEVFGFYLRNKFGRISEKTRFSGDALQIPVSMGPLHIVTERSIENAHKKGLYMHIWTINEEETMKKLFGMGVDGIFTDDPKLLKKVIKKVF